MNEPDNSGTLPNKASSWGGRRPGTGGPRAESTGPRTAAGKLTVRLNGLRHGLKLGATLLKTEHPAVFRALHRALVADLRPDGEVERMLVDLIAVERLRLGRAGVIEVRMLEGGGTGQDTNPRSRICIPEAALAEMRSRVLAMDGCNDSHSSALPPDGADAAQVGNDALRTAGDALRLLLRYRTNAVNTLLRLLRELDRRQAVRRRRQRTRRRDHASAPVTTIEPAPTSQTGEAP